VKDVDPLCGRHLARDGAGGHPPVRGDRTSGRHSTRQDRSD
jgi:hypothetical protein